MLPSGLVTLMQTARTPMAPTSVPVKVDFMEMEKTNIAKIEKTLLLK